MLLKDLPSFKKPREKLLEKGLTSLNETELLAVVLGSGTKQHDALSMAKKIIGGQSISELAKMNALELQQATPIGLAQACRIVAALELGKIASQNQDFLVINKPQLVFQLAQEISVKKQEHLLALYLDGRHHLLSKKIITIGTLTSSLLHPREVFAPAISQRAASIIIVHNHPSGDVYPSEEDIQATDKLTEAGEILDIPLLDHVIVSKDTWVSLRELKLI